MLRQLDRAYLSLFREYPALVNFAIITGAGQAAFALLNIYALPMHLFNDLHLSGKLVGTTATTFLVFETIFKFPMGRLSDRHGRRPFVTLGPLLICLNPIVVISLPARLWTLIYPFRAADGAGGGALWPPLFAMIGDYVRTERRAAAMAFINIVYAGASAGGIVLGALVAGALHNYRAPFFVATCLLLIAAVTGWFGLPRMAPARHESRNQGEPQDAATAPAPSAPQPSVREAGRAPRQPAIPRLRRWMHSYGILLDAMLISFLMVMAGMTLATFMVKYVGELGFRRDQLVILGVIMAVPAVVLAIPLGHLTERWGRPRVVRMSLVVTAALMWLMPAASHSLTMLAAVGTLLMTSTIMGIPAWLALVLDLVPSSHRGGIMGMVAAAEGVGAGFGPLLGGVLWDINPAYIFYGAAALLTACAVVANLALRKSEQPRLPIG